MLLCSQCHLFKFGNVPLHYLYAWTLIFPSSGHRPGIQVPILTMSTSIFLWILFMGTLISMQLSWFIMECVHKVVHHQCPEIMHLLKVWTVLIEWRTLHCRRWDLLFLPFRLITSVEIIISNYVPIFKNVKSVNSYPWDHLGKVLSFEQCCCYLFCYKDSTGILGAQSYLKTNLISIFTLNIFGYL